MDKNNIIGFSLIAAVLIGFSIWSQPSEQEKAEMARQDSIANIKKQAIEQSKKLNSIVATNKSATSVNDTTALFYNALTGQAQKITLKSNKLVLTLNSKGGIVEKAVIKGFKDRNANPDVTLFDNNEQSLNYTFSTKTQNISTQDLFFTPENVTDSTVTFVAQSGANKKISIRYALKHA